MRSVAPVSAFCKARGSVVLPLQVYDDCAHVGTLVTDVSLERSHARRRAYPPRRSSDLVNPLGAPQAVPVEGVDAHLMGPAVAEVDVDGELAAAVPASGDAVSGAGIGLL